MKTNEDQDEEKDAPPRCRQRARGLAYKRREAFLGWVKEKGKRKKEKIPRMNDDDEQRNSQSLCMIIYHGYYPLSVISQNQRRKREEEKRKKKKKKKFGLVKGHFWLGN
jgi:hypothetical protein